MITPYFDEVDNVSAKDTSVGHDSTEHKHDTGQYPQRLGSHSLKYIPFILHLKLFKLRRDLQ